MRVVIHTLDAKLIGVFIAHAIFYYFSNDDNYKEVIKLFITRL